MQKYYIVATPTTGHPPLTVTFSTTDYTTIFSWDWGDGSTTLAAAEGYPETYSHTYTENGTFNVRMTPQIKYSSHVDEKLITVTPTPVILSHTPITFTWISPTGQTTVFSRDAWDFKLLKYYDGLATSAVTHTSVRAPYQDGATLTTSRLEPRDISFDVLLQSETLPMQQKMVRELASAFNPLNGVGVLVYTQEDGTEYRLNCIGNNTPKLDPSDRSDVHQRLTIDLIAHDPFWYSNDQYRVTLKGTTNSFFPFGFDPSVSGGFSLGQNSDMSILKNIGFVSAPITIECYGEMTDPVITNNTTGEFIGIDLVMATGDTFVITTAMGNKTATYTASGATAVNGFRYLDPESTFWHLVPGDNEVLLDDASIGTDAEVRITWRDRFVGV